MGAAAGFVLVAVMFVPSALPTVVAVGVLIAGWLVTLWAAWFLPVPRPVAEMNAFTARGMWLLKATIRAFMIGATATYGAYVGAAVQLHASRDGDVPLSTSNEWIFAPLLVVSTVLPWIFGMWVARDLFCVGPQGRRLAAERCAGLGAPTQLPGGSGTNGANAVNPSRAVVTAQAWLADAIEHLLRPGAVMVFAYLGPLFAVLVVNDVVSSASTNLL